MRHFLLTAAFFPSLAFADTITATSHVTAVTIYAQGAEVTRTITFTAPKGAHDLLITDLPTETPAEFLRMEPANGMQTGAWSLRRDRLPPREEPLSPARADAKAEVERQEVAAQDAQAAVDAIAARENAAQARIGFLTRMVSGDGTLDASSTETLRSVAQMVGDEVLAANQTILAASKDRQPAQKALTKSLEALEKARAAFDALARPDAQYAALSVAVNVPQDGEVSMTVISYSNSASWSPVYDMNLVTEPAALSIHRGVLVSQSSGEDWSDVALTLSTAPLGENSTPSTLWPDLRSIAPDVPAEDLNRLRLSAPAGAAPVMMAEEPAPVADYAPMQAAFNGETVIYSYPSPVSILSANDQLRLELDEIGLAPEVMAYAVPRYDQTAFMNAHFTNTSPEILLPGMAMLSRDGVLIGQVGFNGLTPGDKTDLSFGAIRGLRLKREMPTRATGDRGVFSKSTQTEETAVLQVENLTDKNWPVRVLDQVPYSEQEDLQITWQATPQPSETDVDGKRGVLAWDIEVAPKATAKITLTHTLSWPEGQVLQ